MPLLCVWKVYKKTLKTKLKRTTNTSLLFQSKIKEVFRNPYSLLTFIKTQVLKLNYKTKPVKTGISEVNITRNV